MKFIRSQVDDLLIIHIVSIVKSNLVYFSSLLRCFIFFVYIYIWIKVQEGVTCVLRSSIKISIRHCCHHVISRKRERSLDLLYCCSLNWRKLWHDEGDNILCIAILVFCNRPPDIINAVNDIPSMITTFHAGYSVKYTCLTGYVG
jgi:hypothetical protein